VAPRRENPPFRAEHVGSLLRPTPLRERRQELQGDMQRPVHGRLETSELSNLEDEAIRDAVSMQERIGLQVLTDGEMRRRTWWQNFVAALDGTEIKIGDVALKFSDPTGHTFLAPAPYIIGPIRRTQGIATDEFRFLQALTNRTIKITLPAPSILHFYGGRAAIDSLVYPRLDAFWSDVVDAYRQEIAELLALGCKYIQLDEVQIACLCDDTIRAALRSRGDNPEELLAMYVAAINAVVADWPSSLTFALHLCRGNNQGHWLAEGSYEHVAKALFQDAHVDAYFLEYDSGRAGGFEPLRHLAADKTAVLGLVSTKTPELETIAYLEARIEEACRFVPIEQLALSPQCGFASNFLGNRLTLDQQWKKLNLVVRAAAQIWYSESTCSGATTADPWLTEDGPASA
jgi:5-methyltetrahydropteroyltriglutamate--homocysteine methyltransferase